MKIWVIAVLAVICGSAAGLGATWYEFQTIRDEPMALLESPSGPRAIRKARAAEVHVADDHYDFGKMQEGASLSHEFVIANTGTAPLTLSAGKTSCSCTLSETAKAPIPPGKTANVTLTWTAKLGPGPFRQSAEILTNDPARDRITLVVEGTVMRALEVSPMELVMGSISSSEPSQGTARIYSTADEDFRITGHSLADASTAANFEVAYEPLPAEELAEHDAQSGVLVTVTVKPGLPSGPVQQKIMLQTNSTESPQLALPLSGKVVGEVSIIGRGWNADRHVLNIGAVKSQEGATRELKVLLRGPYKEAARWSVSEVDPPALEVVVGESTELKSGSISQLPITIRLPKGLPPMNRLGSQQAPEGKITISSGQPDVAPIRLNVRFLIQP